MILAAALRVLMIGNSLTYSNDLPATVERLMDAAGVEATVDSVAYPDVSLGDQWERGTARKAIAEGRYDVVVLQQGPSAAPDNRMILKKDTARFAQLIRKAGGRPALFMVWPARSRTQDWAGVDASYSDAASACGCLLLPAGRALRLALAENGARHLFGADGFHPSAAGSELAAIVIAAGILERDPVTLAGDPVLRKLAKRALDPESATTDLPPP